jgi:lipoyl-dependent peroxiredoxin
MATDRTAKVTWTGSLMDGSGVIEGVGSGAFGPLDVTWVSRADTPDGRTSPEELIAAAWASCYSMALSHALAGAGTPPERLETAVTVTFQPGEGITKGAITVLGTVPGVDQPAFVEQAEGAKANCPVSKALTGIPEVMLDATLAAA